MSRLKYLNTKIWESPDNGFPESQDQDLFQRPNVGVAFSGGGTRSASITLGTLRALNKLKLIKNIRYLSCVSGGCWGSLPWLYLPEDRDDNTFLGQVIPHSELSLNHLTNLDHNSFAYTISKSVILDNMLGNWLGLAGDETFSRALGETFLEPHGLGSRKKFFTWDQRALQAILDRNDNSRAEDFLLTRAGRPFWIAGGTLLRMKNSEPLQKLFHFEMTPLYTGVPVLHRNAGSKGRHIGGGYIEPFATDSDVPDDGETANGFEVKIGRTRHRFTLSDVLGTTGAAPAKVLSRANLSLLGLPEFKHWSPHQLDRSEKEYDFGDGGNLENLGIMPLLRRQVEKIIVFVNTMSPLIDLDNMNDSIPPLFGEKFPLNQVFETQQLEVLISSLQAKKREGKSVIHRQTYKVLPNEHFGIEGDWDVDIAWVYNEKVPTWEKSLRVEIKDMIGSGSLGNFPHYRTFFQNPPRLIDLSPKQTSLLAHLACWNVLANEELFREMLS